MNERQAQRQILAMVGRCFPSAFVHHSPNGGHLAGDGGARYRQVGALKGDGMKPGFPDLAVYWNHGHCLLEVKRPRYTPSMVSPDQVRVHQSLAEMGWPVAIVTGEEEAFQVLRDRGAPWNRVLPVSMMERAA